MLRTWEQPAGYLRPVTIACLPRARLATPQCQTLATPRDACQPPPAGVARPLKANNESGRAKRAARDRDSAGLGHLVYSEQFQSIKKISSNC